jgi:hypothetical protein
MVFYFTTSGGYTIYMGKDKYENEDLIKYGKKDVDRPKPKGRALM